MAKAGTNPGIVQWRTRLAIQAVILARSLTKACTVQHLLPPRRLRLLQHEHIPIMLLYFSDRYNTTVIHVARNSGVGDVIHLYALDS